MKEPWRDRWENYPGRFFVTGDRDSFMEIELPDHNDAWSIMMRIRN